MNNFPYIDILILAIIAIFIINRLKNVLGKKTGNENDIVEKFTQRKTNFKESEPDSTSTSKGIETQNFKNRNIHDNKKINDSLNKIIQIDPNFDVSEFSSGAKKAFEYILTQYSKDDVKSLKNLVSKNIFKAFSDQSKDREKRFETLEITVISVKEPTIKEVLIEKNTTAFIKVCFDSEQVQVTKNKKDAIIEGDSNQILSIKENWIFSKNLKNNDPNWTLEKIEESS